MELLPKEFPTEFEPKFSVVKKDKFLLSDSEDNDKTKQVEFEILKNEIISEQSYVTVGDAALGGSDGQYKTINEAFAAGYFAIYLVGKTQLTSDINLQDEYFYITSENMRFHSIEFNDYSITGNSFARLLVERLFLIDQNSTTNKVAFDGFKQVIINNCETYFSHHRIFDALNIEPYYIINSRLALPNISGAINYNNNDGKKIIVSNCNIIGGGTICATGALYKISNSYITGDFHTTTYEALFANYMYNVSGDATGKLGTLGDPDVSYVVNYDNVILPNMDLLLNSETTRLSFTQINSIEAQNDDAKLLILNNCNINSLTNFGYKTVQILGGKFNCDINLGQPNAVVMGAKVGETSGGSKTIHVNADAVNSVVIGNITEADITNNTTGAAIGLNTKF